MLGYIWKLRKAEYTVAMFQRLFLLFLLTIAWFAIGFAGAMFMFPSTHPSNVAVIENAEQKSVAGQTAAITAGIVPHHLVAEDIITAFFSKLGKAEPRTVVLVSPDHWGTSREDFTSVEGATYHDLPVDESLLSALEASLAPRAIERDTEFMEHEHGVNNLLPFVKQMVPGSRIVPLAVSAATSEKDLDLIVQALGSVAGSGAVVVASSDFSHYLPSSAADLHDATSIAAIQAFQKSAFRNLELDCWQCVYIASAFAEARGGGRSPWWERQIPQRLPRANPRRMKPQVM